MKNRNSNCKIQFSVKYCQNAYFTYKCPHNTLKQTNKNNEVSIIRNLCKKVLIKSWRKSGEGSLVYVNYCRTG